MTHPQVAAPATHLGRKLVMDRDLAIIACERATTTDRVVAVRWAARHELGFPPSGYHVARSVSGGAPSPVGVFSLPDTTSWSTFEADAVARHPIHGPWFPAITQQDLAFLLPLVRLVDPRVTSADRVAQVPTVAEFFGQVHRSDAQLSWHLWRNSEAPPLPTLLADANAGPMVIEFYHHHAMDFLGVLALRFEYAALLGLGTDDAAPDGTIVYEVEALWTTASGRAASDAVPMGRRCAPAAPDWLRAERAPGSVPHPAFTSWPTWAPPPELAPEEPSGTPRPASTLVPQVPAFFSALTWAAKTPENRLLGYGPVLYRISRYDHGPATAGTVTTPAIPSPATFVPLAEGELIARTSVEPHYLDRPGMPWPSLEGHYHYDVHGVDLFGTLSATAARAPIRHHDDLAPMAPRARNVSETALVASAANDIQVPLHIDWDPIEDFNSPDAVEFRIAAQWTPALAVPIHILSVTDVDTLHSDLTVATLAGPANALAGTRLSVPGAEYPIVSHGSGTNALVRIRRMGARAPVAGMDGMVLSAGTPTPRTRIARLERRPAVPSIVATVVSVTPLVVTMAPVGNNALPSESTAKVYLHLLRATLDATFDAPTSRWTIAPPGAETSARAAWDRWVTLPNASTLLGGSPAIVYPRHELTVATSLPTGYSSGLLSLFVTAADDATYVASPTLPIADVSLSNPRGNESGSIEVVLSVRTTAPPAAPTVGTWDPLVRVWAQSATVYVEDASYDLVWQEASGAVRYEVWRALESGIAGAGQTTDDATLRELAAQQASAFMLRSDQVFASHFTDAIPGRAPTRALYRIRSIGLNGERSEPSEVIGPVYVPDVRRPPAPNLVRAVATPPEEADRTIAIEWTQGADTTDVRFDVYVRPASATAVAFTLAGSVARNTAPGVGATFRFLHGERPPGKAFEYRVVAVREALDPFDSSASLRRDISSPNSETRTGVAISSTPLAAPVSVQASFDAATQQITLTWSIRDHYDRIEVQRRAAGRGAFTTVSSLAGEVTSVSEPAPGPGTYDYRVRAFGASRQATSEIDVQVVIP